MTAAPTKWEQLRIALEEAVRGLVEVDAISGVTIDPETATVAQGGTQRFTATVTGTGTVDQSVTWSLSGNADDGTTLVNGLLTVASGETATTLTLLPLPWLTAPSPLPPPLP